MRKTDGASEWMNEKEQIRAFKSETEPKDRSEILKVGKGRSYGEVWLQVYLKTRNEKKRKRKANDKE